MSNIYLIQNFLHKIDEIFSLLQQLTHAPKLEYSVFKNIIESLDTNHFIYVYLENDKILGIITLLIEQKLIHNGKKVAHIEDLVVDKKIKGKGIGSKLIQHCIEKANNFNCYKIILNCNKNLLEFYEKNGFLKKDIQMVKYKIF